MTNLNEKDNIENVSSTLSSPYIIIIVMAVIALIIFASVGVAVFYNGKGRRLPRI